MDAKRLACAPSSLVLAKHLCAPYWSVMCTGKYEASFNHSIVIYFIAKLCSGDKGKPWQVFKLLPYEI
ncbi:hypothetical protein ATS72_015945 [Pseudoalteromonas sp. 13-15]|nr:hypothetical protein ATS72_015945 [Pseudoalteromonas sp. 13-15]